MKEAGGGKGFSFKRKKYGEARSRKRGVGGMFILRNGIEKQVVEKGGWHRRQFFSKLCIH